MYAPKFTRSLVATVVTALALTSLGTGVASAAEPPAGETQVSYDQVGNERSAYPAGDGLKLNIVEGDSVNITDDVALWRDENGAVIASIELDNKGNQNITFRFDEETQTILAEPKGGQGPNGAISARVCMPKWVAWAFNIAWGGLVCIPATLGASGVATPIAGIVTGAACNAAGGVLTTAISC